MEYFYSIKLNLPFDQVQPKVEKALMEEGFGIVSQIDMHERIKNKLGIDFKKYLILGACNPSFAFKALSVEEKIGTMLPCNFLIIDNEDGNIEVVAVNPIASMLAINNPALIDMASEVSEKIQRILKIISQP